MQERQTILMIRGAIASLPLEESAAASKAYLRIREMEKDLGEDAVRFAVCLRGAELQEEE